MTSIKEALKIIQRTIKGDQIEAAVVDVGTMMPLGKVVSAALAQLDSADAVAWQYRDDRWDDDRWHVCAERPRDTKGRRIRALYTGLLPDASPGNGAVTSSVVAKIEEARDLFWDIKGDFSDPRAECRRGADLLEEVLTALHSTSAAGETTSSADGVIGKDGVTYPDTPLGRAYAGIKPGPSEATTADVLAMKEACKRAVSECLNQYGRMTFVTEKGWSGLEGQILAAIDKLSPEGKASDDPLDDLVARFSAALLEKLKAARVKYEFGGELWRENDWEKDCQKSLLSHLAKGDPRDVAAYCAFMWHHGWSTVSPEATAEGGRDEPVAIKPLEWDKHPDEDEWFSHDHGLYDVSEYLVYKSPVSTTAWCLKVRGILLDEDFLGPDAAKAAAQADYKTRILSALEAPASGDGEPVAWMAYCPETGGRCLAYTQSRAHDDGREAYSPQHEYVVVPLYTAPPADAGMREALENVRGFLDTPVGRRRFVGDPFYDEVIASIRKALTAPGATTKPSIPVLGAESVSGAHVADRTGGANPPTGANSDGYDVRFHENVLGQLGATTKSDGGGGRARDFSTVAIDENFYFTWPKDGASEVQVQDSGGTKGKSNAAPVASVDANANDDGQRVQTGNKT